MMATHVGNEEICKLLIHHGAAVNYQKKVHRNMTMHC